MVQDQSQQRSKKKIPIPIMLLFVAGACLFLVERLDTPSIQLGRKADEIQSESIKVAMVKSSLPAMTVITLDHINIEMVSRSELPKGRLVNPTQIIGRILAVPVVEGQVLTEDCFVPEGTGVQLPWLIPHGMRAVTVSFPIGAMPDRALLYPGCVVDVLTKFKLNRNSEEEALSTTKLRGIQVLAISGDSGRVVTLLVNKGQAEALSLAIENGSITLSIRNPLDKDEFNQESSSNNSQQVDSEKNIDSTSVPVQQPKSGNKYDDRRNPLREITVMRGRTVQSTCSE